MSEAIKPVSEILVPMDFSECSIKALEYAKRIVEACGARLHLLYVADDPMLIQQTTDQSFRDEHENKMALKFVGLLTADQREQFRTVMAIRLGTAYNEIEAYAKEQGIELIVMGRVGRSAIADILLGSVTSHVIRYAPCPVLAVKETYSG